MSNWKGHILFVLGIGFAGHKLGTELESLIGISSDKRIIAIIEDSNSLLHQGIYHVQEGERILQRVVENSNNERGKDGEQEHLMNQALQEYKLAHFSIEKAIK